MNEFVQHIAEVEGVRTPKRKRTPKETEAAFEDFKSTRAKKGKVKTSVKTASKSRSAKSKKTTKPAESKKRAETAVETPESWIPRTVIKENPGSTRSAGYSADREIMHVEFSVDSVWEFSEIKQADWDPYEKTFNDKDINSGEYFRKHFRGRKYKQLPKPKAVKTASVNKSEASK